MEQLRNLNELLFNVKNKLSDGEYLEFNKNLLILYKNQKEIETQFLRRQAEQLEDEEEEEPNHSWYESDSNSDTDSDSDNEQPPSFYE